MSPKPSGTRLYVPETNRIKYLMFSYGLTKEKLKQTSAVAADPANGIKRQVGFGQETIDRLLSSQPVTMDVLVRLAEFFNRRKAARKIPTDQTITPDMLIEGYAERNPYSMSGTTLNDVRDKKLPEAPPIPNEVHGRPQLIDLRLLISVPYEEFLRDGGLSGFLKKVGGTIEATYNIHAMSAEKSSVLIELFISEHDATVFGFYYFRLFFEKLQIRAITVPLTSRLAEFIRIAFLAAVDFKFDHFANGEQATNPTAEGYEAQPRVIARDWDLLFLVAIASNRTAFNRPRYTENHVTVVRKKVKKPTLLKTPL